MFMDSSCRQGGGRVEGRTTMIALTVYFYQGISRLGTQTNKVIKLMAESSRPLLSAGREGRFGAI